MVKAVVGVPLGGDGGPDLGAWARRLARRHRQLAAAEAQIQAAVNKLAQDCSGRQVQIGMELAGLVADMELDATSVLAALFCHPVRTALRHPSRNPSSVRNARSPQMGKASDAQGRNPQSSPSGDLPSDVRNAITRPSPAQHGGSGAAQADQLTEETLRPCIGAAAAKLAIAVAHMADSSILDLTSARLLASEAKDQTANIRRMLVAVIDDGRVGVLKLAERVVALRRAKRSSEERKARIATEAMTVFVPLADRLGTWQLKWELEDLALRYLEPDLYKRIARQLNARRWEREARVKALVKQLQDAFASQGLQAVIEGRAKHIYSIWRKMRAKNIPLDEVYDLQAVRIIVADAPQCYAALELVHGLWRHIAEELDDYIAAPKANGYRSIHTAVRTGNAVLEIQIRSAEMHREAELGVCAHWSYKGQDAEDEYYDKKVAWMRKALEATEGDALALADALLDQAQERRVFVHTPKGQVLDLMAGATALDFAYRVHTEIGHQCYAARVDGRLTPLNTPLRSGQQVQVLTSSDATPKRAWLDLAQGYARTSRARSKIRDWFQERHPQESFAPGEEAWRHIAALLPAVDPDPAAEN